MIITVLDGEFSVCQVHSLKHIDFTDDFIFVGKTDRELSLVCRTAAAPDDAPAREDGWKAFRIEGTLIFPRWACWPNCPGCWRVAASASSPYPLTPRIIFW